MFVPCIGRGLFLLILISGLPEPSDWTRQKGAASFFYAVGVAEKRLE